MSDAPALEVAGVSKRFGIRDALRDVDLVVPPGRVHGLLGPNGAGKTTLMRILLGLVSRDAGSVQLLGQPLERAGQSIPHRVAGSVEMPSFYPYLSGRRNLEILARLDGIWSARPLARGRIEDALAQVGLEAAADARVATYSAGMRQRLGLAAALLRSPRLLLLDEPTSALDPAGARRVRALARRLADNGVAVVVSSHDMAEVEELCRTVTILDHGAVIFSDTVDELRARAPAGVHELHTSDDSAAIAMGLRQPGLRVRPAHGGGLEVVANPDALDAYVIALGRAGVAVRALGSRTASLESLFLDLTGRAVA